MINRKKPKNRIFNDSNKLIFIVGVFLSTISFFLLNYLTPLNNADDQKYTYIIGFEGIKKIESIKDIWISQINHYYNWGGRCVVHFIAQFFLLYDKMIFDIANSIIFVLVMTILYVLAMSDKEEKISVKLWILACCMVWFSVPGIGNILWLTGACNYLWGTAIELFFLAIYIFDIINTKKKSVVSFPDRTVSNYQSSYVYIDVLAGLVMSVGGVMAGWTLEAGGITMILGITLTTVYGKSRGVRIKIWHISGIIGSIIGYTIMILAPGNYARIDTIDDKIVGRSFLEALVHRVGRETYGLVIHLGIVVGVFVILLLMYHIEHKELSLKELIGNQIVSLYLFGLGLISVYVMTMSVSYSMRVLVTPAFYMVGAVMSAWSKISRKDYKMILSVFLVCLVVLAGAQYMTAVWAMTNAEPGAILNIHTAYYGADYFD